MKLDRDLAFFARGAIVGSALTIIGLIVGLHHFHLVKLFDAQESGFEILTKLISATGTIFAGGLAWHGYQLARKKWDIDKVEAMHNELERHLSKFSDPELADRAKCKRYIVDQLRMGASEDLLAKALVDGYKVNPRITRSVMNIFLPVEIMAEVESEHPELGTLPRNLGY